MSEANPRCKARLASGPKSHRCAQRSVVDGLCADCHAHRERRAAASLARDAEIKRAATDREIVRVVRDWYALYLGGRASLDDEELCSEVVELLTKEGS